MQIELETDSKHIDLKNSLFDLVVYQCLRLDPITIEKFQSIIKKLELRAANSDLNDFSLAHQTERHSIIKAIEHLEEINQHILKLKDVGC